MPPTLKKKIKGDKNFILSFQLFQTWILQIKTWLVLC